MRTFCSFARLAPGVGTNNGLDVAAAENIREVGIMALGERLSEKRAQMKETRMERGLDHAASENRELKTENRALRDEVERSHEEGDQLRDRFVELAARMERMATTGGKKRKRGRRLAFLGLAGLAAWAFGSSSGRRKVAQVKERIMSEPMVQDLKREARDALQKGDDPVE
jgi:hypothetical protein